jgi:uncharacterized protein YllA (UPF0747 family)
MNTTRKQVLSDRSHNIDGSGKIISDKRYWVDVDQFNNAVQEFEKLKVFIIEQLPLNSASDPAVKKALNDWLTCIISVNEAVDRIVASQGKSTQAFGLACRLVKTDFTRANDFYYEALRTAANVSKKYRSYSTVNSPVTSERITELLKYYYERKLELR